jgi:predicted metal-binding protein
MDDSWYKGLIEKYDKVDVCYDVMPYGDMAELTRKRNEFNVSLIKLEQQRKREGHYFALTFISGGCTHCEEKICTSLECIRQNYGRTPVCGVGIDIQHLVEDVLVLQKEQGVSYWLPNLTKKFFEAFPKTHLCVGMILY